ncbi:PTS sugar transporter subunit IIB [Streptomyces sp. NPDC002795]|uniref:PTS sugar transporter subunit IIB n=1 Tax=Streptomyces sp. NPDC002795 TaxID=3364665 RepID=UPI0036827E63
MRVLIVCGAGASSGFIAQRMRKAAKKQGVDLQVDARSETELEENLDGTDVLLVGPHLKYMIDEVTATAAKKGVKATLIPQKIYGSLDGEAAFQLAQELGESPAV